MTSHFLGFSSPLWRQEIYKYSARQLIYKYSTTAWWWIPRSDATGYPDYMHDRGSAKYYIASWRKNIDCFAFKKKEKHVR